MLLSIAKLRLAARRLVILSIFVASLSPIWGVVHPPEARAANDERINELALEIDVHPDGSMIITESISVTSTGEKIKRGIVYNFGRRPVEVLEVTKDGIPTNYHSEIAAGDLRMYVGERDVLLAPGRYKYMLKYKTDYRMHFVSGVDYFYWNVTEFWGLPVDYVSVTVNLPDAVTRNMLKLTAYMSSKGVPTPDYETIVDDHGRSVLRTTRALAPDDIFLFYAAWPAGYIIRPEIEPFRQSIAAGESHSCAITTEEVIRCWGNNGAGQLGDGTTASSNSPVVVRSIEGALGVTANLGHTCAWTRAGNAYCWGLDFSASILQSKLVQNKVPNKVAGLTEVVQITAGYEHVCALLKHGEIKCWGANSVGQLGDGTTKESGDMVSARTSESAIFVDAGISHTCAALIGGRIECWGSDSQGRKTGTLDSAHPVSAVGVSEAVAVAAGRNHTCALTRGGSVRCWGSNIGGMLGRSGAGLKAGPADVENLESADEIDAGMFHTCAKLRDGNVACWGEPVPAGSSKDGARRAHIIEGVEGAVGIATSAGHSCALSRNGTAKCWGYNNASQLGDGTQDDSSAAVDVLGL